MKFTYNLVRSFTLLLLSVVIAVPAVHAAGLEEIVVTAQKREQNLQDVPISVSAFTGDILEDLGVARLDALGQLTPGLSIRSIGAATIPYIRGVGADAFAVGNESPNAVYLDGAYVSYTMATTFFEFFDIERVEVLKGPQGTLFGRNATGGAINVHTLTPTDETTARLELTYGRFDDIQAKGYLSGALSADAGLYGSVSLIHKESDGWLNNINPFYAFDEDDISASKTDAIRAKLRWEASDNFALTLTGDWVEAEEPGSLAWQALGDPDQLSLVEGLASIGVLPAAIAISARKPYDFAQGVEPFGDTETTGLNLTAEWATDFADIKYIGGFREFTGGTSADGDATPVPIASFFNWRDIETTTHEVQLSSNSDSGFNWVAGLFYFDDEAGYGKDGGYPGLPSGLSTAVINVGFDGFITPAGLAATLAADPSAVFLQNDSTRLAESNAIYGQGTWDLTDRTSLTVGARYTEEDIALVGRLSNVIVPDDFVNPTAFVPVNIFTGPDVSESYDELTWSVILDHHFTDNVMGYASIKTGFKSGVYDTGTPANSTPTEPESIDAIELGIKSTLCDDSLRLNAALFHYEYDNLQVNSLDQVSNSVVTENAAAAEITGAELNLDWAASDNLTVMWNLSLLDTEYTDYPSAAVDVPTPVTGGFSQSNADLSGFPLTQSPEWSTNIGVNYEIGALSLDANFYFTDSVIYNQITNFETGSYENINASATWRFADDQYYLKLWGKNLTDVAIPGCNAQIPFGNVCHYLPPATYGVTAGFRFGG